MLGTLIWIIGVLLCIKAALEIWNTNGDTVKKLLFIILLLITSWVGLLVYYLLLRGKMGSLVK